MDVTVLLRRWGNGERDALDALTELVYPELRKLAQKLLRHEQKMTLQPTAVVHEAWLRLAGIEGLAWSDRRHLFAVAAILMRRVLVDHARARKGPQRGGGAPHVTIEEEHAMALGPDVDLLDLDAALTRLQDRAPRRAQVVELRYFAGLSFDEIADALQLSKSSIEKDWTIARAYLRRELARGSAPSLPH